MTLSYGVLWGVVAVSYLLGYCTGALLKQMSLANAAMAAPSMESAEQAPDWAARQVHDDLQHALHERNLAWWNAELERRRHGLANANGNE